MATATEHRMLARQVAVNQVINATVAKGSACHSTLVNDEAVVHVLSLVSVLHGQGDCAVGIEAKGLVEAARVGLVGGGVG